MLKRRVRRRASRSLLWGLVAFAGLQLVLAFAVERRLPEVRDPEYADKLKRLRTCLAQAPGHPLVLMLGSSRTFEGFQATRLSKAPELAGTVAFNFGLTGCCSFLELVCLHRLLDSGFRPDLLLLEVLPASLNQARSVPLEEDWVDGSRLKTSEVATLEAYHSEPARLLRHWCRSRGVPCAWNGAELQQHFGLDLRQPRAARKPDEIDSHGWRCGFQDGVTAENRRHQIDFTRWQYGRVFGDFHLALGPARALRDVLNCCRKEQIKTMLVLMPEGPAFRSWYTLSMRAGLDCFLQSLKNEYDLPLIDARAWLDEEESFRDSHHLLPSGASRFTDRLAIETGLFRARLAQAQIEPRLRD